MFLTDEMEELIARHSDLAEYAVSRIDDEKWGQVPMEFVVIKDGE